VTPSVLPSGVRPLTVAVAFIGLAACLVALPVVIVLDGPVWGWVLGTALWSANWGAQRLSDRIAYSAENPVMAVGVAGISRMARAFAVFLILMLVGLKVSEPAALAAGGVFVAAFTLDLLGRTLTFQATRRSDRGGGE